jgi:multiple sugar transport system permease protein
MSKNRTHVIGKSGWMRTLGAAVVSAIYFFPVYYILMTAFKTRPDALAMPIKFLFTPTMDNFYSVFVRADIQGGGGTDSGFSHYFFNSLFIGGTSVSLALIMGTAAAYGFSRFPLRGNDT